MKRQGGVSIVPCKVNGLSLNFIFDTGASDVSISLTEATFMLKNGYLDTLDIIGTSKYFDANGNISEGVTINIKEIEIGGLKIRDVKAAIIKNMKAPLLLGQSAISKLGAIQVDLIENTIKIFNNKNINQTNESNLEEISIDTASLNEKNEGDYRDEILNKYEKEDYEGMLTDCNIALNKDNSNEEMYFFRALAKDGLKNYNGAIIDFNKSIKLNSKLGKAYAFRGITYKNLKKYTEALNDLNKAILLVPKNSFYHNARGVLKQEQKKHSEAILDFTKAIQFDSDPIDPIYYFNRAFSREAIGRDNEAILDYTKTIQLNPDDYSAYTNRGNIYLKLQKFSLAMKDYNSALDIKPDIAQAYYSRGRVKEALNDYEGALKDYDNSLKVDSSFYLASIYKTFLKQKLEEDTWVKVLSQNGNTWYIKSNVESNMHSEIRIWIKIEHKNKSIKVNGMMKNYSNVKTLLLADFNCHDKLTRFISEINYSSSGKILSKKEDYEIEWGNIIPDTIQEALFEAVCKKFSTKN